MKEMIIVDARELSCPEPVIRTMKALEMNSNILVIVDNVMALENVKRLGSKVGCAIEVDNEEDGTYRIHLSKGEGIKPIIGKDDDLLCENRPVPVRSGPFVIVFPENRMGRGSDELGEVLIRAFIHTLPLQETKPDTIIFYNSGVKLTVRGAAVLDDLKTLAEAGVEMLVCGTCVNYYDIAKDVAVGTISNMYDIAGIMSRSGRLVMP
jgi:selenium metabolism protein YedF